MFADNLIRYAKINNISDFFENLTNLILILIHR